MKLYRPTSFVVVLCVEFVEVSTSFTSVPAIVAPCGSVTCPEMEPVADCAQPDVAPRTRATAKSEKRPTLLSLRLKFICPYPFQEPLRHTATKEASSAPIFWKSS